MIRGAQKKMIVLRTHQSRLFEEAYFVMRHNADEEGQEHDILREANLILEGSLSGHAQERQAKERRRRVVGRVLWFLTGLVCGGGGVGVLWMVLGG